MIIEGILIKGLGKASKAMAQCIEGYKAILNETIFPGTFNVQFKKNIYLLSPTIRSNGSKFWKVEITKPKKVAVWIYKQSGSEMPDNQLQILSQHKLRSYLGIGTNGKVYIEINRRHVKN